MAAIYDHTAMPTVDTAEAARTFAMLRGTGNNAADAVLVRYIVETGHSGAFDMLAAATRDAVVSEVTRQALGLRVTELEAQVKRLQQPLLILRPCSRCNEEVQDTPATGRPLGGRLCPNPNCRSVFLRLKGHLDFSKQQKGSQRVAQKDHRRARMTDRSRKPQCTSI